MGEVAAGAAVIGAGSWAAPAWVGVWGNQGGGRWGGFKKKGYIDSLVQDFFPAKQTFFPKSKTPAGTAKEERTG